MYLILNLPIIQKNSFFFTIHITLRPFQDKSILQHKIDVTNNVTCNIQSECYATYTTEPASGFLHRVISIYYGHKRSLKIIPEKEIVFISDPKDITRQHYLEQFKSMLCRKLIRRFHVSTPLDFEYYWLPDSLKELWVCFTF